MATPYSVQNDEGGRDIASEFNEEAYAGAGLQPSVGERETIPLDTPLPRQTRNTRVTSVVHQKNRAKRQRLSGRLMKAGTVIGASMAIEAAAQKNRRRDDTAEGSVWNKKNKLYFKAIKRARRIMRENQDLFQDGDELTIAENPPEMPPFPSFIFLIAVLKDHLDVLDVTFIAMIFTTLASLFLGVILAFWVFGKASGGWWKKMLIKRYWKKYVWKRYVVMFLIELLPFFKIIPATTIFILMAHYREKKLVKIANLIFEEMHSAGLLKRFI